MKNSMDGCDSPRRLDISKYYTKSPKKTKVVSYDRARALRGSGHDQKEETHHLKKNEMGDDAGNCPIRKSSYIMD